MNCTRKTITVQKKYIPWTRSLYIGYNFSAQAYVRLICYNSLKINCPKQTFAPLVDSLCSANMYTIPSSTNLLKPSSSTNRKQKSLTKKTVFWYTLSLNFQIRLPKFKLRIVSVVYRLSPKVSEERYHKLF